MIKASLVDPVLAYDRIAPQYAHISSQRRHYLDTVERLILCNIPGNAGSLLDIGSGDGARALRLAQRAQIAKVVLLEPSSSMRALWPPGTNGLAIRAEELRHWSTPQFDVVTCLWNVLGHVGVGLANASAARAKVLSQCLGLLAPGGIAFVDVNHRYNAAQYGYLQTFGRYLRDKIRWSEGNGDVVASWEHNGERTATLGHVFTDREFRSLCRKAEVHLEGHYVIDYETGAIRNWSWRGHLLYLLRRKA